jgi:hypothetical protein
MRRFWRRTLVIGLVTLATVTAFGVSLAVTATASGSAHLRRPALLVKRTGGLPGSFKDFEVVPATKVSRQSELIDSRCQQPVSGVTCAFAPTGPLKTTLGKYQAVAGAYSACGDGGEQTVTVTDTTDMSDSLGVSVSVELGNLVRLAIDATFNTTWSTSFSQAVADHVNVAPYTVNYAYRAAPLVEATGTLLIREKGSPLDLGDDGYMTYELTDVVFTAPDTSGTATGEFAFVARDMTPAEKSTCRKLARLKANNPGSPSAT